jgi:hypothetical protein
MPLLRLWEISGHMLQYYNYYMEESGVEESPKITRRQLLKTGAALGLSSIPFLAWFQNNNSNNQESKINTNIPNPPEIKNSFPDAIPKVDNPSANVTVPTGNKEKEVKDELAEYVADHPFFSNCTEQDKRTAVDMVREQVAHYQNGYKDDPQGLEERTNRCLQTNLLNEINRCSQMLGYKNDSPVPKLLPSLFFVESEGKSGEESHAGAVGLGQLSAGVAQDAIERMKSTAQKNSKMQEVLEEIKYSGNTPDRLDRTTNIYLTLEHLAKLYTDYPDFGIAFWAYHNGIVTKAIEEYALKDLHLSPELVDRELSELKVPPGTHYLVKDNSINFVNLITSDNVKQMLRSENAIGDDTEYYVPRIAAAGWLISKGSN